MVDISEEESSLAENIPLIHIHHIKHIHNRLSQAEDEHFLFTTEVSKPVSVKEKKS